MKVSERLQKELVFQAVDIVSNTDVWPNRHDATSGEIGFAAGLLFMDYYEELVNQGSVAIHGLNRVRRLFNRPLKAPVLNLPREDLDRTLRDLVSEQSLQFIHFSPDDRGKAVPPPAYIILHEPIRAVSSNA